MEGIDHVHILQIRSSSLISQIYRMIQRQIPDGERFKLCIARLNAPLMLVIQLAQACGQLAAAGAGSGNYHHFPGGLNVVIAAEALIGNHMGGVCRITFDGIVMIHLQTHSLQPCLESPGRTLAVVSGKNHAGNI